MPSSVICVLVPFAPSSAVSVTYTFAGINAAKWAGCAKAGGGGGRMCWLTRDLLSMVWTSGEWLIRPS